MLRISDLSSQNSVNLVRRVFSVNSPFPHFLITFNLSVETAQTQSGVPVVDTRVHCSCLRILSNSVMSSL